MYVVRGISPLSLIHVLIFNYQCSAFLHFLLNYRYLAFFSCIVSTYIHGSTLKQDMFSGYFSDCDFYIFFFQVQMSLNISLQIK